MWISGVRVCRKLRSWPSCTGLDDHIFFILLNVTCILGSACNHDVIYIVGDHCLIMCPAISILLRIFTEARYLVPRETRLYFLVSNDNNSLLLTHELRSCADLKKKETDFCIDIYNPHRALSWLFWLINSNNPMLKARFTHVYILQKLVSTFLWVRSYFRSPFEIISSYLDVLFFF